MFDLIILLSFVSHFFACIWVFIGYQGLIHDNDGWIKVLVEKELIVVDYWSVYLASLYWIISTFTSVGYGEISGKTIFEELFCILVEMIGIGFYGYMIGAFQQLFIEIRSEDQFDEEQTAVDQSLMALGKVKPEEGLSTFISRGFRIARINKYKYDSAKVQDTEFFIQLKPRLQREVIDFIFEPFYSQFKDVLEGVEHDCQREIFKKCE